MVYALIKYTGSKQIQGVVVRVVRSALSNSSTILALRCDSELNELPDGRTVESFMSVFHCYQVSSDGTALEQITSPTGASRTYTTGEWNALSYKDLPLTYRRLVEINSLRSL